MIGKLLAHFELLEKLGEGGMGAVYKARDTHLGRAVAVKILAAGAASNPEHIVRFQHEAHTASSLNHPNIVQIYDIGQAEGVNFIAMEYISGHTLRQIVAARRCTVQEMIHFGVQILDALIAAHAARILHRDLKPANIMVYDQNRIKVLDFGLAKLLESAEDIQLAETIALGNEFLTEKGDLVGTVAYMSPEQARGEKLDERSDLFSAGALLYEMAAGRPAFPGATVAMIFDAILNKTPAAPVDFNPDLPAGLAGIISKALEKDPARRYQTAREMRDDLELLEYEVDPRTTSLRQSATWRYRWDSTPRSRRLLWPIVTVIVLASIALAVWLRLFRSNASISPLTVIPFTSFPGGEYEPAFSPDGSRVAFVWNGEKQDNFDIYVKLINAGEPLRLTTNPAGEGSPAWSPDGQYIAFLRYSEKSGDSGFYTAPALGGAQRKIGSAFPLAHIFDRHVDWSPDGKSLAVVDKSSATEAFGIFLLSVENGERRRLTSPPAKSIGDTGPVFSPDGRTVAFKRTLASGVDDIYVVPTSGGAPRRLTYDNRFTSGNAWTADGRDILFWSARKGNNTLWRIPSSGGQAQSVTGAGDGGYYLAISRQGNRLAYSKMSSDANVWRLGLSSAGEVLHGPEKLIASTRQDTSAQYSPDATRIAFRSDRSGSDEIWVCDASGANPLALTSFRGALTGTPRWSPDGQYLAFDSRPSGNADIYVIRASGGTPRRITTESSEDVVPSWSGDGTWV